MTSASGQNVPIRLSTVVLTSSAKSMTLSGKIFRSSGSLRFKLANCSMSCSIK